MFRKKLHRLSTMVNDEDDMTYEQINISDEEMLESDYERGDKNEEVFKNVFLSIYFLNKVFGLS